MDDGQLVAFLLITSSTRSRPLATSLPRYLANQLRPHAGFVNPWTLAGDCLVQSRIGLNRRH